MWKKGKNLVYLYEKLSILSIGGARLIFMSSSKCPTRWLIKKWDVVLSGRFAWRYSLSQYKRSLAFLVFIIFQWDSSENAGFTKCSKASPGVPCPWLPVAKDYEIYNVENQEHSLLETFRNISKLRDMEAFKSGEVYFPFHDEQIFSFLR